MACRGRFGSVCRPIEVAEHGSRRKSSPRYDSGDRGLVFTTTFYPDLFNAYHENLARFGQLGDTCVWVVGDRKTPAEVDARCREVTAKGLRTTYLDCEWQEEWAKRYPEFASRLAWNNETRRNIAYLHALESGCDRLISIDDDTWPTEDDFVGGHLLTGQSWREKVIEEPTGLHNVCGHIDFTPSRAVFQGAILSSCAVRRTSRILLTRLFKR